MIKQWGNFIRSVRPWRMFMHKLANLRHCKQICVYTVCWDLCLKILDNRLLHRKTFNKSHLNLWQFHFLKSIARAQLPDPKCGNDKFRESDQMSRLMTKPTNWHVHPAKTDQPVHLPSLITVFALHMEKAWVLSYALSHREDWSDWSIAEYAYKCII